MEINHIANRGRFHACFLSGGVTVMKEGQMITAMAKLEGIELIWHRNMHLRKDRQGNFHINGVTMGVYNPLENYALTFKAMVDYDVNTENGTQFDCGIDGSGSYDIPYFCAFIDESRGQVAVTPLNDVTMRAKAYAIIECILKSKGLWVE